MARLRELLLWAGAALGLLAVTAGIAVAFGGFGFLIFRSGSMSPEIPTGGLALSRTIQAPDLRPGDVVSVVAANGDRITHRIVDVTLRGDEASLILKGDANATADSEVYAVTSAERVVASVPYGGYVLAHALTPPGLVALACLSMIFFLLGSSRDLDHETQDNPSDDDDEADVQPTPRSSKHRAHVPRRQVVTSALVGLMVVGSTGAALGTGGTLATFTDPAKAATGTLGAASIAVPATPVISTSSPTSVTLIWAPATPVGGTTASRYEIIRYLSLEATSGTVACSTTAPVLTCTDPSPAAGTTYYGLRARIGENWFSDSAARVSYSSDTTPPNVTITTPINNCVQVACGTATDVGGGTVEQVEWTLQRRRIGKITGTTLWSCWNGTNWSAETTTQPTCAFAAAQGTASWSVPGSKNTAYQNSGLYSETFTLTVRATDTYENTSPNVTSGFSRS